MATTTLAFDIIARDKASKTFDTVGSKASSVMGFLGRAGKAAAGGFALAATGAGILGIKTAAANEQAAIAFTTMLGSGKKAQAFLSDLQGFAAKTPFEFPELQTAASSLISAGIEAKKVIPIMTTLGDVTSGMGTGSEGVKRATVALQQMSAAGRITGEDLNQLRDAGIPVYDLLASATGKSKQKVVELAQAGKLGKQELGQMMKALETGKGLERFSGLMEKQSASLTGMWSTLKDTLGQGMAEAVQPLMPLLKQGLAGAIGAVGTAIPVVVGGIKNLKGLLQPLGGIAKTAGDAIRGAFSGGGGEGTSAFVGQLTKAGSAVRDFVTGLMPTLRAVGGQIMGALGPAFTQISTAVTTKMLPAFRKVLPIIQPVAAFLIRLFGSALVGVIKGAANLFSGLATTIGGVFRLIRNIITGNWSGAWKAVKQIASGAMQAVKGFIQVWWNAGILNLFRKGVSTLLGGIWKGLWSKLKGLATSGGNAIQGAIGAFVGAVKGLFTGAVRNFGNLWSAGFRAIRGAVSSGISTVVGLVRAIPGKITGALGNLGNLLSNTGRSIIQGLIDGVSGMIGSLRDKFTSITNMIPDWKGPRERDKRLLTPAGVSIMEGLIRGIESGERPLKMVLGRVTDLIEKSGEKLKGLLSARADFAAGFQSFGSSVFGADVTGGVEGAAPSARALIAYQAAQAKQAGELNRDVRRLVGMGLSKSLITQLQGAGSAGIAQIGALADASPAEIRRLNALNRQTERRFGKAGAAAGQSLYGDDIERARDRHQLARSIARELGAELRRHKDDGDVHVHLEGRDLVYSIRKHKRKTGAKVETG